MASRSGIDDVIIVDEESRDSVVLVPAPIQMHTAPAPLAPLDDTESDEEDHGAVGAARRADSEDDDDFQGKKDESKKRQGAAKKDEKQRKLGLKAHHDSDDDDFKEKKPAAKKKKTALCKGQRGIGSFFKVSFLFAIAARANSCLYLCYCHAH
jgi:hypothetical protein